MRPLKATIRRRILAVLLATLVIAGVAIAIIARSWHGLAEPPRVGETAAAIIERIGRPDYDSRVSGSGTEDDYDFGYTDGLGTRHHLRIGLGVVTRITYSSR